MFNLTIIRDALVQGVPELKQVILPEGVGSQAVDSARVLVQLVEPHVSSRVYPLILPDAPTYPAAVYQLVSSPVLEVDGYPILREDGYLLSLHEHNYGDLRAVAENVRASLLAYATADEAGTVKIIDQADKHNAELQLFETGIALEMTHLALSSQATPCAFVYASGHDAEPTPEYNEVQTEEGTAMAVLTVARIPTHGISALGPLYEKIQNTVNAVTTDGWEKPLWEGGEVVAAHNSLALWRENFRMPRFRSY